MYRRIVTAAARAAVTGSVTAIAVIAAIITAGPARAGYNPDEYAAFLAANATLGGSALAGRHMPPEPYYLTAGSDFDIANYAWLDSTIMKLELTPGEIDLLAEHGFMVTGRVDNTSAGFMLHELYLDDLPVFISTDVVLNAFHYSFDHTWEEIEITVMKPNLMTMLAAAYDAVPTLAARYSGEPALAEAVADAELYITVARSLLEEASFPVRIADRGELDAILTAVANERYATLALFSDHTRAVDFSQFIPRGRYDNNQLRGYFRAMMWLGRMEFYLTPPPDNPWEEPWTPEQIRRMCMGAMMVNELVGESGGRGLMEDNERITDFLVGESDNCTPAEYDVILAGLGIESPVALMDAPAYDALQSALLAAPQASQQILGNVLMVDPYSPEPSPLPASYRLMGQRFVVDSYIFSNVVFDRIVRDGEKIWRPLPDPLDAMFALGNDDAVHLLQKELDAYQYAPQLASLRYLVDAYEPPFWESSIYNRWLSALRALNPGVSPDGLPAFAATAAWRQEKLTTQLASWAHLRHDTLLYAKQSYTGGTGCSFPHSYVEPYPEFFRELAMMGEQAAAFFAGYDGIEHIVEYYTRFAEITARLATLAEKQLAGEPFSGDDETFCQSMLFEGGGGSGTPPFSGWFAELHYRQEAESSTQVIADVHTQPTDRDGNPVGNVLHVGSGMFNLAVVLAPSASADFAPMAFAGPVMSYYELVTENFDRMDDGRWRELIWDGGLPARPDWINAYCANAKGDRREPGRMLPAVGRPVGIDDSPALPAALRVLPNTPNPFNPATVISFVLPSGAHVRVSVYDILGRRVATLADRAMSAGAQSLVWDACGCASGVYICRIETGNSAVGTVKMLLMK